MDALPHLSTERDDRPAAAAPGPVPADGTSEQLAAGAADAQLVGLVDGAVRATPMSRIDELMDATFRRPRRQWWMGLRPVMGAVSQRPDLVVE